MRRVETKSYVNLPPTPSTPNTQPSNHTTDRTMQRPVTTASMSKAFFLAACCTLVTTTAFVVPSITHNRACPSTTRLHAAASVAPAGSVAASLEALHDATMAKLTSTLKVCQ